MKKAEWERLKELDLKGLRLLGAALELQAANMLAHAQDAFERAKNKPQTGGVFAPRKGLQRAEESVQNETARQSRLQACARELETSQDDYKQAKTVMAKDFRFRWDHLRDHPILVACLKDRLPRFSKYWDIKQPIAEMWGRDPAVVALTEVFFEEYAWLNGHGPEFRPQLTKQEDFLFYVSVWELCEPERGRGQPSGRRWPDGAEHAAAMAYAVYADAEKNGTPIAIVEAIRQSMKEFEVVSTEEFWTHPDRESTTVTASGTPGDRMSGAIKTVRRLFKEIELSARKRGG